MDCCRKKPAPSTSYEHSVAVQAKPKEAPSQQSMSETGSASPTTDDRMRSTAHVRFASTEQVSMVTALRTSAPITLTVIDEKKPKED